MSYKLAFDRRALKEWHKLGDTLRQQFKKKLAEVIQQPSIEANVLHGLSNCYKIKLRSAGYRLIYQVQHHTITVLVIAIGKRENQEAYRDAEKRLDVN